VSLKKLTVPERKQDLTDLAPQGDFISAQAIEHIVGQIDDPQRTTPACAACDVICSGTVPDFRSVPVENLGTGRFRPLVAGFEKRSGRFWVCCSQACRARRVGLPLRGAKACEALTARLGLLPI
jgi:hypothetical protein